MKIRLVTFDLDDTLWKTGPIIQRAERKMLHWIDERDSSFREIYSAKGASFLKEVVEERPEIAHDITAIRLATLTRTFENTGKSPEQAASIAQEAFAVLRLWRNKVELFDGALEVLELLKEQYLLASLTNGNAEVDQTPLANCFDLDLSAASVGAKKPDPRMFVAAMNAFNVTPDETVHVGDHPIDDMEGARDAGLRAIQIDFGMRELSNRANATINDLRDLPHAIASLTD